MRERAITASGTAPANSSFTKRCCTACDQPASLAARRVSVKRSGMTLVPVEPLDCEDSGSARKIHACARISADLAHKSSGAFFGYWLHERDRWFESGSLQWRVFSRDFALSRRKAGLFPP